MKPDNYPQRPAHLWEHFYQFTRIPRPSKQEAAVRQYLVDLAQQAGHPVRLDDAGNLVIYVPASPGREDRPTVIIQNHLDMVTVKTDDVEHDFTRDPLQLKVDDGWLGADRTTLGADNGLGCAASIALMTDPDVTHPPLELLFTVDEETGLGGALNLDASMLSGSLMLNLDTEDWNELYIGCAGGAGWQFARSFAEDPLRGDAECFRLNLRGLAGGHSGVQIHEQLGNAIKLLGECLRGLPGLRLGSIEVGVAHNVIPREGVVEFAVPAEVAGRLAEHLENARQRWLGYLPAADHGVELALQSVQLDSALDAVDSLRLLDLIAAFPHGAQAYSLEQPADLVDLSINLAILRLQRGELYVESSYRFFNEQQSLPLQHAVLALARAYDLEVTEDVGYPGWEPDFSSPLLEQGSAVHQHLFGARPAVKAIHAGLECGILKSKLPGVDTLSFGPTIRGAHSPSERLRIDTVEPFWRFLTELLADI
ncbi:aminoacyl-histidine dipeptidase [Pseudohalioglobus sediminis]|uniref:Cytosol non-specific dipeptidase n=1 Tax=Pseudohalioglobus sediminis TaxID=2606449 RepID=A0A5B0WQ00_9GAMM|nr:beta-Ala-His dipeptidase [Pseudohalioglobus sediminis]KAA1189174.1 aminoacyl-histidine dipeptidase [Pseudohalioglobus sediminis]